MPGTAFRDQLVRKRIRVFTKLLHGVHQGEVGALHRARVTSRRLRELLPLLEVRGESGRKVGRRLRQVTQQLGAIRELDVLSAVITELQALPRYSGPALDRMAAAMAEERQAVRDQLDQRLAALGLDRLAARLGEIAREVQARDGAHTASVRPWLWVLEARVARRAYRLVGGIRDAGGLYLPDRLHAVRIAVKKLRYALELAHEAGLTKTKADLAALKRAQSVLGRVHDWQVLIDRTQNVQGMLTGTSARLWSDFDRVIDILEDDCRRMHAQYVRMAPRLESLAARLNPPAFHPRGLSIEAPREVAGDPGAARSDQHAAGPRPAMRHR